MKGFDEFSKKMRELSKAAKEIDGLRLNLSFDPSDPAQIEAAICQMETEIDTRLSPFSRNDLVTNLAATIKEKYRQEILDRAAALRLEKRGGGE